MRMLLAFLLVLWTTSSAFAQSVGLLRMGMSPAEVELASPGNMQIASSYRGATIANGSIDWFGRTFSARYGFSWNVGLHTIYLRRVAADAQCDELFDSITSELQREFGELSFGALDRPTWRTASATRDFAPTTPWAVRADLMSGPSCSITVSLQHAPIPASPDPLEAELEGVPFIDGTIVWEATPTREQVLAVYPRQALVRWVEGEVDLACRVRLVGGGLRCMVLADQPINYGFRDAALDLAENYYRIAPIIDGVETAGRQLRLRIEFRDPPEDRTEVGGNPFVLPARP